MISMNGLHYRWICRWYIRPLNIYIYRKNMDEVLILEIAFPHNDSITGLGN